MYSTKSGRIVFSVFLLSVSASCVVTKAEGEQMSADIARLKSEIAALQRDQSDFMISDSTLKARVTALERITFKKASGDSEDSERLKRELEDIRGQLEETQKNLEDIKGKKGTLPLSEIDTDIPSDKKEHFEWAHTAFIEQDFTKALSRIESFIERYPDDRQYGAESQLLKGDTVSQLAKQAQTPASKNDFYKKAIGAYQDLLTRHPKSPKIPEGLFKAGETLETMGYGADAKVFYEEIMTKHKKSAFAKKAQTRLSGLLKKKK